MATMGRVHCGTDSARASRRAGRVPVMVKTLGGPRDAGLVGWTGLLAAPALAGDRARTHRAHCVRQGELPTPLSLTAQGPCCSLACQRRAIVTDTRTDTTKSATLHLPPIGAAKQHAHLPYRPRDQFRHARITVDLILAENSTPTRCRSNADGFSRRPDRARAAADRPADQTSAPSRPRRQQRPRPWPRVFPIRPVLRALVRRRTYTPAAHHGSAVVFEAAQAQAERHSTNV